MNGSFSHLAEFREVSAKIINLYKEYELEQNEYKKENIHKLIVNLLQYKYILYDYLLYEGVFKRGFYHVK